MDSFEAIRRLAEALRTGGYDAAIGDSEPLKIESLDLYFGPGGRFWPAPKKDSKYPHVCPRCKGPAYVGFTSVDCQGGCS